MPVIGALTKYVIEMGCDGVYLDEVAEHHSQNVNPTELTVSHTIFEALVSSISAKYILVRLGLSCACFSAEKVDVRIRPMPDMSRFYTTNDFVSLGKNTEALEMGEAFLKSCRATFEPVLSKHTTLANARKYMRLNEMQCVRMMTGKPAMTEYGYGSNNTVKLEDPLSSKRTAAPQFFQFLSILW